MTKNPKLGALLFAVVLAGAAMTSGTVEAGLWGYRTATDPIQGIAPMGEYHNEVPPGWIMSRPDPTGQMGPAIRDPGITFDPTIGTIRESYTQGGVEVQPPMVADLDDYSNLLTARTYRRLWRDESKESRSIVRGGPKRQRGALSYDIPIKLPKVFRGLLGDGTPNIDVSGSETITLTAASDWTVRREGAVEGERARPSAFPSLEMKQDLQVNLTGSIGDKIKVDVDQSSNVQSSLDNKVKLRYEGDEDDMIKSIDLGNTNLSLQGASIRQEGLFGIKTVAKLGNVDVVTIASKQEGKTETSRFTPSGEKRQVKINDLDYIHRQYFFVSNHAMRWDATTLKVFRDDRNGTNDTQTNAKAGFAVLNPNAPSDSTNPRFDGSFDILTQGLDYEVINPYLSGQTGIDIPIIKMRYPMNPNDILAVSYVEDSLGILINVGDTRPGIDTITVKLIKPSFDNMLRTLPGGTFDPTDPWYPALHYELRNFYDLTAKNIARETLTLKVRKRDLGQSVDPDAVNGRPLIEILGLDQQGTTVEDGPDGRLDDRYMNFEEGILFFPDVHPFDPGCNPGFLCQDDTSRNILSPDSLANPNVYYTKTPDVTQSRYYIDAEFKSSQAGYFLGRFNILENSEQVKVNGIPYAKGSQYNIDYDTGQLTFTSPPGPDDVISVDYSFAPGISQVQRTLLGFSTSYSPSADLSVTSSMLYESRGAQELNPKLGEEPARSMVTDLASVMTFRPSWMTQFANVLPGVHTSSPSTLNLQGNVAVSMPNPNTKGEAYVDDMEGNRESNTLALGRLGWLWSSIPVDSLTPRSLLSDHALIQWYNPRSDLGGAKERDLKPILTNEEGGDNEHTVLEMNISSLHDSTTTFASTTWSGLTQAISRTGQDLSRTRFIEIWVNDRRQGTEHALTSAKLHIDFGRVSEDAFWDPRALPNHLLDTEDKNKDTKLDRSSDEADDEDTGLDGLHDDEEPGFTGDNDPNGDNSHYVTGTRDYSRINGTENNGKDDPNARPDTEDLNLDGHLDEDNDYFEVTLDLADTAFVAVDVARDYAGHPNLKPENGWRLFRIPLDSPAFKSYGRPSWDDVKHARLWIDGMTGPTNLQIGGVELVGSRWLALPLPDALKSRGVIFDVKVRNNKDDAAIYTSPFDVPNAVGGNATRREQSLALSFANLGNRDSVFAFKAFSDNGSGVGYTQYRDIRFYAHGDPGVELQNLRMFARFGPDTVNYYEYSLPVRAGWQDVRIPMEILSRLKESSSDRVKIDSLTNADTGARYTVVGNPSFTRVNRINFGLTVYEPSGAVSSSPPGEVWIDELRLDGVRKDVGKTGNVVVQANFADVLSVSGNYQKQDQDFFRVGSGANTGTGLNHTAVGASSTIQLDRMLPVSGLELPVTVQFSHAADVPKYRTGSDVILDKTRSDLETRRADRQSIDFRYRRTGPRAGWTRWTIDAINGSMRYQREASADPQFIDSTWTFSSSGNYNLPIGGGKGIPLSKNLRLKYLPDVVTFGVDWSAIRRTSYSRSIQGLEDSLALRSNTLGRALTLRTDASYVPITGITTTYRLQSTRDMLQRKDGFLGNVGTEVAHTQSMNLTWTRRVLFLTPNITLLGAYREDASAGVRINANDPLGLKNISNTGSVRTTATLPLSRFTQRLGRPGSPNDSTGPSPVLAPLRFVLSRVQDIQTTFSFDRASAVSRVVGSPGFAYVTGFTQKFNETLFRAPNSNIIQSHSYFSTANTTVVPINRLTVNVHADHRLAFSDNLLGARKITTVTWPDLNGSWLQLQQPLGLSEMLTSLVVSSRYSVKNEDQGPTGKAVETHTKTTNWGPLLHWEASFKNGIRADVNTAISKSRLLDVRQGALTRDHITKNHDVRLTKVYPASKGIRFPWSKRRVKLPNDVNLNLTLGIVRDRQVAEQAGVIEPLIEADTQRLNVGSGTTYNFTPSITGGFDLSFTQTKDYKYDLTTRGLRFAVNGQFRF